MSSRKTIPPRKRAPSRSRSVPPDAIPRVWRKWCMTGSHRSSEKEEAVLFCLKGGVVRGYFSDLPLDPTLPSTDAMYPSVEHLAGRKKKGKVVVETRIVNDMKSILSEDEFWQVIGHLYSVGLKAKKTRPGRRPGWRPDKDFSGSDSRR